LLGTCAAQTVRADHQQCRSHCRESLKHIKTFYRIEAQIKGLPTDERRTIRQEKTLPRIEAFEQWLAYSRQVSAKSPTGLALKYIAKYWGGLNLFLTDGRIEIDNNTVKRCMRPIALNRKTRSLRAMMPGRKTGQCSLQLSKPVS